MNAHVNEKAALAAGIDHVTLRLKQKAADKKERLLDEHTTVLSAGDRDALRDELGEFRRESVLDPTPAACAHALRAVALLPQSTLRKIIDLRYGNDCDLGIVLIRNTPLDPETPHSTETNPALA